MGSKEKASFRELVRYADSYDRCLMALGVLGSFGDGMMQPLSMLVLGDIVNSYGGAGSARSTFSSGAVDKVNFSSQVLRLQSKKCSEINYPCAQRNCSLRFGCCSSQLQ